MGVETIMRRALVLAALAVALVCISTAESKEDDTPSWGSNEPGGPEHHVKAGKCKVDPKARKDCGKNHRDECVKAGCCWAPNQEKCAGDEICPWCFNPDGHSEL